MKIDKLTAGELEYIRDLYGCEPYELPHYEVVDAIIEFREVN